MHMHSRVAPRLPQYWDPGTFSRYRSVPGRIRYRPKFPRDFGSRVPGTPGTAGSRESIHKAPITAEYAPRCPRQHSAMHTTRSGTDSRGRRWPRVCHHACGGRRWCPRRLLISYGNGQVASSGIACGEPSVYRVPCTIPSNVGHMILALLHKGSGAGMLGLLLIFFLHWKGFVCTSKYHFFLFCFTLTPGQGILSLRAYYRFRYIFLSSRSRPYVHVI